ncbi:MAG TPA: hypothetical protein VD999_06805 [Vitreimonas sp.]|nr:hypothetical protein [Vitreimonas sp.]
MSFVKPLSLIEPDAQGPPARWVHVDINSYFATLLQQENPALRGKPIGVVKDLGRTCVIASSKEAKKLGVKTGCYLTEALRLAPDLMTVPANFDLYLSATTRLKKLFDSLSPDVDIFSLDEAFINLTYSRTLYPDAWDFARLLQAKIKDTLGEWVTCNVGISHNRLLAKMTSEVSPKGSITEVTPDNKDALLARVGFEDVCGVGFRLAERLQRFGVTTPFQINFIPDTELEREFGPFWSVQLRKIGQGEEPHFFNQPRRVAHMQMVGRSLTCYKLWNDEDTIKRILYNLIDEVIYKVRKLNLAGWRVGISLRGHNGQRWGREMKTPHPVRHTQEMFDLIYYQLYQPWQRTFPIVKCSVRLTGLHPWGEMPQVLWPEWHQREKLSAALDKIIFKHGLFAIRSALLIDYDSIIKPEVTGFLGDKDYQLSRLG